MNRISRIGLLMAACVPLAAHAQTWTPTAAGTYSWNTNSNWTGPFPNAPGALANLAIDLGGSQTVNQNVNLNQPITVGVLNLGDTSGTSNMGIASGGNGSNTLTFQSATPGGTTSINNTSSASWPFSIGAGVILGGTSPLNVNLNGPSGYQVGIGSVNLNGNTLTVNATNGGTLCNLGTPTGNGQIVVNAGNGDPANLGGVAFPDGQSDLSGYTGSLTVNNGALGVDVTPMPLVSTITLGGAWPANQKYAWGGRLSLGNHSNILSYLPDRLPHNGTLVMNGGGFFDYQGAVVTLPLAGTPLIEQVKTIQLNVGVSEIRLQPHNTANAVPITLLANDPNNALVRVQGATFMAGGDDGQKNGENLGALEFLKFNSGIASQLKGAGGAPGSQNQSIIPWMVVGTYFHPATGGFATYDNATGVHRMPLSDYRQGSVLGAPSDSNMYTMDLNLGVNHTQTINSLLGYNGNTEIGAGSTLTVSSGGMLFTGGDTSAIGNGNPANAGTLNFGTSEGIIFTEWATSSPCTVTIGSRITGSNGLTVSGTTALILKGANAYTGQTTVDAGIMQIGDGTLTTSKLGAGNLVVCPGATVIIKANVSNAIADSATVTLGDSSDTFFGTMNLESGINETVGGLVLGGVTEPAGTYGSSSSSATFKNDSYFSGPGILTVVPEPTSAVILLGAAGLALQRRSRQANRLG